MLFAKEAKLLANFDHENVVKLLGVCENPVAMVMEYMNFSFQRFNRNASFCNLDDLLCYMSDEHIFHIYPKLGYFMARDITEAVDISHSMEIVHRDHNVLVFNLHYDFDTMQTMVTSRPVICKLGDLGEARSKILQTRNLVRKTQNQTKAVNRGSVPFQAPGTLVDELLLSSACIVDLKHADMWSLLMTPFHILNPNQRYPFQYNIIDAIPTEKSFKDLIRQETVPTSSPSYLQNHALYYQVLRETFYSNFQYDPAKRVTLSILLEFIEPAFSVEINFYPLSNSQSTALESADREMAESVHRQMSVSSPGVIQNDGTNACAFLALGIIDEFCNSNDIDENCTADIENVIKSFPAKFNPMRNVEKLYDIEEAYDILLQSNLLKNRFTFNEDFLEKKEMFTMDMFVKLKGDLLKLMCKAKETESLQFGIIQADVYISSLAASPNGKLFVFETHPISIQSHGNGNGMIVVSNSRTELIQWLILRLENSGVASAATPFLITVEVTEPNPFISYDIEEEDKSFESLNNDDVSNQEEDEAEIGTDDDDHFEIPNKCFRMNVGNHSQVKVSRGLWFNIPKIAANKLPNDIDGLRLFNIKSTDRKTLMRACQDGRKWKPDSRTDWKGYISVRYRDCFGSFICTNHACIFFQEYVVQNSFNFNKGVCVYCITDGAHIKCCARKYTAFCSDTEADVYHYGIHNCTAKGYSQRPSYLVAKAISSDPGIKPANIQNNAVVSLLRNRESWEEIGKMVESTYSLKRISNEKVKQMKLIQPKEGFDSIKGLKAFTNEKDKSLIYKVDEDRQIVFKTSSKKMKLTLNMDVDSSNFLGKEYCNFDGNHKRVVDFVTLTASVYHPLLKKQVILATMQCKHENEITILWELFNKAYQEVNGVENSFNPKGFCSDMAGANFSSLINVFGEEVLDRAKGCEVHFKLSYGKQMKSMDPLKASRFEELAKELLYASLPTVYQAACAAMLAFLTSNNELISLLH